MAKRPYLLPVVAALIVGMYVLGAVGALPVSHRLMLLPFLALGPLGIVGVLELGRVLSPDGSSMLTLILNLWSFPRPPADAGLLDLGPVPVCGGSR